MIVTVVVVVVVVVVIVVDRSEEHLHAVYETTPLVSEHDRARPTNVDSDEVSKHDTPQTNRISLESKLRSYVECRTETRFHLCLLDSLARRTQ